MLKRWLFNVNGDGLYTHSRMSTMLRGPAVLVCLVIVLLCVLGFGFNSYRSVNTRLSRSEEHTDKLKSQYDAVVAQTRVLQEHKTRLDARLQSDAQHHKEELEEILSDRKKMGEQLAIEKNDLKNRITSLTENGKRLENELLKVTDGLASAQADVQQCKDAREQMSVKASADRSQLKQECTNDAVQLMDNIANLERRISELQSSGVKSGKIQSTQLTKQQQRVNRDIHLLPDPDNSNLQIPLPGDRSNLSNSSNRVSKHPLLVREQAFALNPVFVQKNSNSRQSELTKQVQKNLSLAASLSRGVQRSNEEEEVVENQLRDNDEREAKSDMQHLQQQKSSQLENQVVDRHIANNAGRHDVIVANRRQSKAAAEEEEEEEGEEYHEEQN